MSFVAEENRARIERALRFIADNLGRPLTVKEVAAAAHLSEFHFHRVFSAAMNEPVGRFITRRRLEVAALRLAYEPSRSVTEIALASGYSSSSNFSKAFSAFFGCSPTRVRSPGPDLPAPIGTLTRAYGKDFHPRDLHALPPGLDEAERSTRLADLSRQVRFELCPGIDVACLASPDGYDLEALLATWSELIDRARQLGFAGEQVDAYGMAFDSPQLTVPELCRYHACVPCPATLPLPDPLFRGRIPAGRYAVFRYQGSVTEVESMYRSIYSIWFPASSLAPDEFTVVDHYISDFPVDGRVDFEIWIKVRTRT